MRTLVTETKKRDANNTWNIWAQAGKPPQTIPIPVIPWKITEIGIQNSQNKNTPSMVNFLPNRTK